MASFFGCRLFGRPGVLTWACSCAIHSVPISLIEQSSIWRRTTHPQQSFPGGSQVSSNHRATCSSSPSQIGYMFTTSRHSGWSRVKKMSQKMATWEQHHSQQFVSGWRNREKKFHRRPMVTRSFKKCRLSNAMKWHCVEDYMLREDIEADIDWTTSGDAEDNDECDPCNDILSAEHLKICLVKAKIRTLKSSTS